jgi:DNA-binding response OmpR family regulator
MRFGLRPIRLEWRTGTSDLVRVQIVDDEVNIAELVATALRYEGFAVRPPRFAPEGRAAPQARTRRPA